MDNVGTTAMVCFENLQMDSSSFGARSAMPVGPGWTTFHDLKLITEAAGTGPHLNDLPSQRQYATKVWIKGQSDGDVAGQGCERCGNPATTTRNDEVLCTDCDIEAERILSGSTEKTMAIRESSLEAFRDLQKSGGLSAKQLIVLTFVFKHQDVKKYGGMITRADVEVQLADDTQSLGPRFAELERLGMLTIAGKKTSCKTRRTIQGWRVPDKFDDEAKARKRLTTKQALEQLLKEAEALVGEMRTGKTPLLCATMLEQAIGRAKSRTLLVEA